ERELRALHEALEKRNAELAAANSILAATLDATPVGVLVIRRDGAVGLRNRRFEALWALGDAPARAGEDWVATVCACLAEPADFENWLCVVRAAPEREHEFECRSRDGRHLHCRTSPQRQGATTVGVVFNWLDVTERVQSEELQAQLRAAELAARAKAQFISRASHELRTPLNAVLGFSQLLQRNPIVLADAQIARKVGHIRTAGEHLRALMDDLLQISRVEMGALALEVEPIDLAALLRQTVAIMQPQADQRSVEFVFQPALPERAWILGDGTAVRRVLMNLLSNAIKYNRPQGRVTLRLAPAEASWGLEVVDTGAGLVPEQVEHLFEPFNRLGAERSGIEGTGLGLAITHQLVQALQGRIEAQSWPGVGSCFTLSLPRAPGEPAA
ncbi:MAG: PAS domain-containing sensor histidine kinase, partial [Burkholderiales bacterium]|nr:PAS domain-containing sensor histidine kinase [Burkholderiales bacterium]